MEAPAWAARVPVLGAWDAPTRRKASLGSTLLAAVLVGFTLVAFLINARGMDLFLLVILALLVLALVFQALVVLTGLGQRSLAPAGAAAGESWEAPAAPPMPAQGPATITLKCSSCATVFDVHDTGERPLRHTCPGCGAVGELSEADIGPGVPSETAKAEGRAEPISLKCGSCGTVFDVADTGERPLRHTCPGCGAEGVLGEEDIGPPPAAHAAPAAPAPAPAAPRPPVKKVKTLKLRCKSCSTVFTLRDTGDRPLYHECPGCKATGVLR